MSDSTWVSVRVPKEHCGRFEELLQEEGRAPDAVEEQEAFSLYEFHEIPGGMFSFLTKIASTGIVFSGCHGAGIEYGAHDFVGDGNCYHSWETGMDGGFVLHPEFKNGNPLLLKIKDRRALHDYLKAAERVEKYLLGSETLPKRSV